LAKGKGTNIIPYTRYLQDLGDNAWNLPSYTACSKSR